ncbi:MAG: hypothetical protein HZC43_09225 [Nitrosomonadales bacterium]|nr:hypothetical protein [Nitrosomonadales bacterium]
MSQHDYSIAAQPPAALLADLNAVLGAIATNNSGATAPNPSFPYQWWADTTSKRLKIRNATNTGWVTVGNLRDPNLGLALVNGSATKDFAVKNLSVAGQIKFPVGSSSPDPSTLDCYLERGFDISISDCQGITFRSGAGIIRGNYTQIGRLVHFNIFIKDSANGSWTANGVDIAAGATIYVSHAQDAPPRLMLPSGVIVVTPSSAGDPGKQVLAHIQDTGGSSDLIVISNAISGKADVFQSPDMGEGIIFVSGTYMTV